MSQPPQAAPSQAARSQPAALSESSPAVSGLFVGTSGWAYPTWKPDFYPPRTSPRKMLSFYASQLNSVEVNYTFRTLPKPAQLEDWLSQAGEGFRFSFKAPQAITHFKRLRECEQPVTAFLQAIAPVAKAGRLGLLLFQLPPNFKADPTRLAEFLALPALAGAPPLAFEFRHPTWFAEETYAVLRAQNASLCIAETDDLQTPEVHTAATHSAYRLRRAGGYPQAELDSFAQRFLALSRQRDVYVYLKHEDEPTGAMNARALLASARHPSEESSAG